MTNKITTIFSQYKNSSEIVKFAINAFGLGLLWVVFYSFFRNFEFVDKFYQIGTTKITNFILASCKFLLESIGYKTVTFGKTVRIIGSPGVYLDKGCLARNLMGLFAGFMLAYPGLIKKKLWYLPLGLVVIQILNILRLSGMALITLCCPEHIDINHHYIFKIAVFGAIFFMWYLWIFKMNTEKNT